jgi:uncharacterized Tic20 family protein
MTDATPPTDPYQTTPQPLSPSDERLWATLIHVGGIFFSFVPALIGYLVLKDRGAFVRAHSISALNFQLSFLIYSIAYSIVIGIIVAVTFGLASPLLFVPSIVILIFSIIAALAANKGESYKYPLSIEFIK